MMSSYSSSYSDLKYRQSTVCLKRPMRLFSVEEDGIHTQALYWRRRESEREREVAIATYTLYITESINKEKHTVQSWDPTDSPFYRSSCNLFKEWGVSVV